jgi:hypothetical protein
MRSSTAVDPLPALELIVSGASPASGPSPAEVAAILAAIEAGRPAAPAQRVIGEPETVASGQPTSPWLQAGLAEGVRRHERCA